MTFEIITDSDSIQTRIHEKNLVEALGQTMSYDWMPQKDGSFTVKLNDTFYKLYNVQIDGSKISFQHKSNLYKFTVKDELALLMEKMGFNDSSKTSAGILNAPMPGKIVSVLVKPGDSVEIGKAVVILEAMKMENELKSTVAGTVKEVAVTAGQSVEKGELLLEIA